MYKKLRPFYVRNNFGNGGIFPLLKKKLEYESFPLLNFRNIWVWLKPLLSTFFKWWKMFVFVAQYISIKKQIRRRYTMYTKLRPFYAGNNFGNWFFFLVYFVLIWFVSVWFILVWFELV